MSSPSLCSYPRSAALHRPNGGKLLTCGVLSFRLAAAKARPPSCRFSPPLIDGKARPPRHHFAPLLTGGKLLTRGVLPSRPVALHRS